MRHDYASFGAYYTVTSTFNDPTDYRHGQPILYGSPRLHYIQCAPDVYYIRLAKDPAERLLDIDKTGEFLCAFRLDSVDGHTLALAYMLTGDTSGFHPVTQQIIAMDEAEGLDREHVVERRAGIMTSEFLGFTPEHVFMQRPEISGTTVVETEDGPIQINNFNTGSWYVLDNPEFMNGEQHGRY